ncbi:uncharacterized protein LOC120431025 [Culex pipiens pallens]|uniref:uncharacterized protein LOC120431025 n=1 Tax=Culex pipiens pallens TaxID=42434 RepID=UPI001953DCEC|nr:uncharacterized protein LOC120431025 [Culex pipiens pallens]
MQMFQKSQMTRATPTEHGLLHSSKQLGRCRYHHRPLLSRRSTICTVTRLRTKREERSEDCLQRESNCNPYEPVMYEEIQVEGIYAAPYENCFYRAVLLKKAWPDYFNLFVFIGNLSSRTALVMLNSAMVKPVNKVHEKTWLFYTLDNGAVELISDDKQIPYLVMQMDISRVIIKKLEFKQLCLRLSYDQQARIMKATLTDVEKKGQLAEVTLRNVVCDLKQVDVNYWPHIPQGKSIVRITFVLDAVTLTVCPNVYSKLLLTILPE